MVANIAVRLNWYSAGLQIHKTIIDEDYCSVLYTSRETCLRHLHLKHSDNLAVYIKVVKLVASVCDRLVG